MTAPPRSASRFPAPAAGALLLVLAVALAARLVLWLQIRNAPFWSVPIVDERTYLELARDLLAGRPPLLGAWYQAPGYVYLLALAAKLGLSLSGVKLLQLLFGAGNALLVTVLGRRWFGPREGLIAGLIWAVYPGALFHEILLLKPTLAVTGLLAGLLALAPASAAAGRSPGTIRWLLAGLALGAAALLRTEMAVVGALLAAAGWWARRRGWPMAPRVVAPAALLLALGAVLAVPTVQNAVRGGGFVPVAYGGGVNFWIGNHAGAQGGYTALLPDRGDSAKEEEDAVELARERAGRALGPAEVNRFWWREGLRWWGRRPLDALGLTVKKLGLLWGPQELADVLTIDLAARWAWPLRNPVTRPWLVLPPALAGLWLIRRRRDLWPLFATLAGFALAIVPFFVFERFRLPMTAAALPLAAHAAVRGWDALRSRRWLPLVAGLLLTVALGGLLSTARAPKDTALLRVNLGGMLLRQDRFDEALVEFRAVRREVPTAWRVGLNIATTLARMGRPQEALAELRPVLDRLHAEAERTGRPSVQELVYAHQMAGDLLAAMGRTDEAAAERAQARRWRGE